MMVCRICGAVELNDSGTFCRDCAREGYNLDRGKAFILSQEVSYYQWRFQVKADTPVKKGELIRFGRFFIFGCWYQMPDDWRAYEESLIEDYCLDVSREETWEKFLKENGYER